MSERGGMKLGGWSGGEALGGVGRGERVIRIFCMKKNVFNRKGGIKNHALTLNCGKKKTIN